MNDAHACDVSRFSVFFNTLFHKGFYLPPSQFETAFVSAAHVQQDIDSFVTAVDEVFAKMASNT